MKIIKFTIQAIYFIVYCSTIVLVFAGLENSQIKTISNISVIILIIYATFAFWYTEDKFVKWFNSKLK